MTRTRDHRAAVRHLLVVTTALVCVAVAACGSSDTADPDDSAVVTGPTATMAAAGTDDTTTTARSSDVDGYPRTVQHANGSTVVGAAPERIVAIGQTDETVLLAFGVEPVGYARWYGDGLDLSWPWIADLWSGELPTEINDEDWELKFETIAKLEPDLIIGLWASADAATYDKLSAIAPTVIRGEEGDFNNDWRESTRLAGAVLDQEARAEQLIAAVDDRFAAFRSAHPELQGLTAAWISPEDDGSVWYYAHADSRGQFLGELGFAADPGLEAALAGPGEFGVAISAEQLELLGNLDLIVVSVSGAEYIDALEAGPLYNRLAPVQAGNVIELVGYDPPAIAPAVSTGSALSLVHAIDAFGAELPDALGRSDDNTKGVRTS